MYVAAQALQLALFGIVMNSHVHAGGAVFLAFVLFGLRRRWRLAWGFLLFVNAILTLGVVAVISPGGGQILWANVFILTGTTLILLAILGSPAMRTYVGIGHNHRPAVIRSAPFA